MIMHRTGGDGMKTLQNEYFVVADGKPLASYGVIQRYSKLDAQKKQRAFGGTIVKVSDYPEGKKYWQQKLTEEQVIDIKTCVLSGIELAKKYGVTKSTISKIRNGHRWKDIMPSNEPIRKIRRGFIIER